MSPENSSGQSSSSTHHLPFVDNSALVPETTSITDHSYHLAARGTSPVPSVGNYIDYPPSEGESSAHSCSHISKFRETDDLPSDIANIIEHGVRKSTKKNYQIMHKNWVQFAHQQSFNPYCPSVKNVLAFLHSKYQVGIQANTLFTYKTVLKWVVNSSHHFILDSVLISQYFAGLFNLFPVPPRRKKDVWDVNIVLDYWNRQPFNSELSLMMLSQKVVHYYSKLLDGHFRFHRCLFDGRYCW